MMWGYSLACKEQAKYRSGGMLGRFFLAVTRVRHSLAPLVNAVESARAASSPRPLLYTAVGASEDCRGGILVALVFPAESDHEL